MGNFELSNLQFSNFKLSSFEQSIFKEESLYRSHLSTYITAQFRNKQDLSTYTSPSPHMAPPLPSQGVPLEQGLSRLGRCNASRVITHTMAGWINRFRSSSLFSMETNYLNRIRPYFGLHSGIFMWGWKPRWIFSARRYHQTWMGNPKEYWKVGWEITQHRIKLRWTSMSATVTKTLLIAQT